MSASTTDKVKQLEEKVKELEIALEAWRQTAHRQDKELSEKEEELARLRKKLEMIENIITL